MEKERNLNSFCCHSKELRQQNESKAEQSFIEVHSKGGVGHSRETKMQETPGGRYVNLFFFFFQVGPRVATFEGQA